MRRAVRLSGRVGLRKSAPEKAVGFAGEDAGEVDEQVGARPDAVEGSNTDEQAGK
jgi:hypothetical protein